MQQRKEHVTFADRMAFASELYLLGAKGEELLSRLYCHFLPETTGEEGDWVARHVVEQIRLFDEGRKRLLELSDRSVEEIQTLLGKRIIDWMDGFTMSSQCRKLRSMNQGMNALGEVCEETCTLEEVVQIVQPGYRGNTGEKGRNTELQAVLENLFRPLNQKKLEKELVQSAADFRQEWMDDTLYRAILTIVLSTIVDKEENSLGLQLPLEYLVMEVCRVVSTMETSIMADQREYLDSAVVKLFLTSGFLAGGTGTVMFTGSAIAIYAVYFLAVLAVRKNILA